MEVGSWDEKVMAVFTWLFAAQRYTQTKLAQQICGKKGLEFEVYEVVFEKHEQQP